ncbi:replication restart helicase PriA [Salegentibacter mishustinae]|uniref:Replication restart protein PriA n=1 Tax=Salegentibacter mishustinae TaxID=270918 RepID=A0A0Q9ZMS9_9FLAO|nr:primosomal protein N' [Salegentibacter mishustinae]KRG29784.1 primosomal protein N' [Salegentibacter mishustinae]PNW21229.1 primosomal protein N' [Salegentibacter mishustinae]PZX61001.1 replication restart DNA helicase PriA [Salegentibacter mishustinae]GGW99374.1 primosomal protein N' [Salegentibacter mishustinae]
MPYFIDVILPLPLQKRFTYAITEAEANFLEEGMRVAVPFGKSKVYTAIMAAIHQNPPQVYEAKPINQILDKNPLVTKHQLKFWAWIASYYMCAEGDVLKAALPGAFLLESESIVELKKDANVEEAEVGDEEYLVIEALQRQSSVKIQEVMKILDKKTVLPIINALVQKELVVLNQEIYEQYKPKKIRFVRLNPDYDNEARMHQLLDDLEKAPKQKEALLSFFSIKAQHKKPLKVKDLSDKSGVSAAIIKSLIKKKILEEFYEKTDRVTFSGESSQTGIQLSEIQQKAFSEIEDGLQDQDVCLFHGITSSGKTEIYIKLIEKVIANGQQALYVLPEIALTTQLIERLRAYFGDKVLVYHSKYSINERVEVYRHILEDSEKARIVIGARSSIFLPFANLGLVVVDEEHETSFKQFDPAPRYHARDAAVVLANLFKAKTILGSATPSLESYFNAQHHKYAFVELNRRYGNVLEPEIEIVDIKTKYKKKEMKGHFSDRMLAEIKETLDVGEQVILFQNRRGFSPVLECNTCGHSPQCPNCDVSLTYHSHNNQLRCHYCGYHIAMQKKCMACDSPEITTKGFGTEQIETELKAIFPDYKTARMDQDTTRGKYAYEKLITAFEQQEIDILIGTQMLTKGLDFRKVNLVGIMNADNLLNFPDFRAHERSFQLMLQVAGRAGRTKKRGKVLIQSYNPHHQIIQQVSMGDYAGMYKDQLEERYNYKYPPFYRLIRITLKCRDYSKTNEGADWLAAGMKNVFKENVLGPEFPPVARIRNEYHKNILLKIPQQQSLGKTKKILQRIMESFKAIGAFRSIKVVINVDPI